MIRVAHKYMPDHMSEEELKATFTAREHTLDYLTEEIRKQTGKQTLTSYLITGPRGAGKTTLIRMLYLRLCQEEDLAAAWLPVSFPEELPNVTSLRDLLATALDLLADQEIPEARDWHQRVENEENDAHSQELAIAGLQQIAQAHNKRLILLIENLDMLFERGISESTRATLRRLLMTDPFMMIIGSAVQIFPAVRAYDEAFFNYFCPVPLERLNEQQAGDILKCRAKWDGNEQFDKQYQKHKSKIRAISMLTGGNPRFLLMVYEILTLQEMGSAVQALRALVDELTPLLKDILEHQLTPQQVRILDALMQLNGKAKPSQLAQKGRLPLNVVTTQLKRLVEADLLDLQGGGKGRPAWYTVTDRLFYTWYQMRYLRPQRRRIEMFVEVLQLWFEADERIATLRSLSAELTGCTPARARLVAQTTEYFAASLEETPYMEQAQTLAVQSWIKAGEVKEALALYNEGCAKDKSKEEASHSTSYVGLSRWLSEQGDMAHALEVLKARLDEQPGDLETLMEYGVACGKNGDYAQALSCFDRIVTSSLKDVELIAQALLNRGFAKRIQEDYAGAISDYTEVIELVDVPVEQVAKALVNRGFVRRMQKDYAGAIADYKEVIKLADAPVDYVAMALFNRGFTKGMQEDYTGEITDYTEVIELTDAPIDQIANAFINRGVARRKKEDYTGAISDFTEVIELTDAPVNQIANALINRGVTRGMQEDYKGEITDYTEVIELTDVPVDYVAMALFNRGVTRGIQEDYAGEITDYTEVIELTDAPVDHTAKALFNRGQSRSHQGERDAALKDWAQVLELSGALPEAYVKAGIMALYSVVSHPNQKNEDTVITALNTWLARFDVKERTAQLIELLATLAEPKAENVWIFAVRRLIQDQSEVPEELSVLTLVADVLETGDESKLDPLPPEQRDFALEVLKKFKSDEDK